DHAACGNGRDQPGLGQRRIRRDAGSLAPRQCYIEVGKRADRGVTGRGLINPRLENRSVRGSDFLRLEEVEAVVEEGFAVRLARVPLRRVEDDRDQPRTVALGGGDEAVPGLIGVAGLQAIDRRIAPQQPVAVRLLDVVPGEVLHAEDVVILGMKDFPWNHIKQPNRNGLLWSDPSVDGLKTGHTDEAGYCLIASAKRNGTRLISVVLKAPKWHSREADSEALLNYGFNFFQTQKVATARAPVLRPRV